jgi:flagellar protein FlaC
VEPRYQIAMQTASTATVTVLTEPAVALESVVLGWHVLLNLLARPELALVLPAVGGMFDLGSKDEGGEPEGDELAAEDEGTGFAEDGEDEMDGMDDWGDLDGGDDDWGEDAGGSQLGELEDKVNSLETDLSAVSSSMETVKEENRQLAETVEEADETIRKLLDVYEIVTRGINPFVDDAEAMAAADGSFGLFGDQASEEPIDSDIAGADAESFFDDDFDDFEEFDEDDDEDNEEVADADAAEETDDEDDEDDEGSGASFDDLKAEYEADDGGWEDVVDEEEADEDETAELDDEEETEAEAEPEEWGDELGVEEAEDEDEAADPELDTESEPDAILDPEPEPEPEPEPVARADGQENGRGHPAGDRRATANGHGDGRPYLERVPEGYAAELVLLDWARHLVDEGDAAGAVDAFRHYERLGWISEPVRRRLATLATELCEEPAATAPGELGTAHHQRSLEYVSRLAGAPVTGGLLRERGNGSDTGGP